MPVLIAHVRTPKTKVGRIRGYRPSGTDPDRDNTGQPQDQHDEGEQEATNHEAGSEFPRGALCSKFSDGPALDQTYIGDIRGNQGMFSLQVEQTNRRAPIAQRTEIVEAGESQLRAESSHPTPRIASTNDSGR